MKRIVLSIRCICIAACALTAQGAPQVPMQAKDENSMKYRWLSKEVIESRLLDDCEHPETWEFQGMKGEMSINTERAKDGKQSVRLRAKTKGDGSAPANRPWGSAGVVRGVEGEDWGKWNRISVWIYPDLPGFKVVNVGVLLHNDGKKKVSGQDYVIVKNHQWNQVLSEIEYCDRDKVTGVEIQYRLQGNEAGATDTVQFDIDHLELQRVEPDKFEGWDVAPGRISFSHVGYPVGSPKTAIASHLSAREFKLIKQETGKVVVSKPVRVVKTPLGEYQLMDFSEVRDPGNYFIQAGATKTGAFRIDKDVWQDTIRKTINFFYAMRCGYEVPGVHGICHKDWVATQGDKKLIINGGWHDAGDLSQGLINTADSIYSMLSLAERLRSRNENPELSDRLIEEAKWGLDWLAKTTLHNGSRVLWAVLDFWTDGVVGDEDDPRAGFGSSPYEIFAAASAEALAYRVLKDVDPTRAARSLEHAREDWAGGLARLTQTPKDRPTTESPAGAINASIELFRATGEQKYADKAIEIAPQIVDSQERTFIPGTRISGFLYYHPTKNQTLHSFSPGAREHNAIIALARLVESFPQHKDWMKWYSALGLYSEYYLKNTAKYTEPYGMLPDGIYWDQDYLQIWEGGRKAMQAHVAAGRKISEHHYLRNFPIWEGFGNLHLVLTMAKALAVAAQIRGDLEAAQLAERQIEWILGRNPFSQSFMYGEGYDYHDYYNISGHIVGGLPVGLPTHGLSDAPYWPPNSWFAPMEVWVQPAARLIYLMRDVAGPALVEGRAKTAVQFKEAASGAVTNVKPDASGNFRAFVAEGKYVVRADGFEKHMTLLPSATYRFDPTLDFVVSSTTGKDGQVMIELTVAGQGTHDVSIRTDNLVLKDSRKQITVQSGRKQKLVWLGKVENVNSPWFAVVVPNDDLTQRKEANGAVILSSAAQ